jgi:hypothetical protein
MELRQFFSSNVLESRIYKEEKLKMRERWSTTLKNGKKKLIKVETEDKWELVHI